MRKMSTDTDLLKTRLRKQLRDGGRYTSDMDPLIELCAGSYAVWRKLQNELGELKSVTVVEVSREGNQRLAIHPLVAETSRAAETFRRQLSELLITPKAKTSNTRTRKEEKDEKENPLAKMLDKIEKVGND